MPSQRGEFQVQREPCPVRGHLPDHDYQPPVSAYRLTQAEALLREMGYVRHDDGTWHLPDGPALHQ